MWSMACARTSKLQRPLSRAVLEDGANKKCLGRLVPPHLHLSSGLIKAPRVRGASPGGARVRLSRRLTLSAIIHGREGA